MKNVVLDTNCLLQILGARSRYAFLLDKFLREEFVLCVSTDILLEYEEILSRKASHTAADLFLKVVDRSRNVVRREPHYRLGIIRQDNDDNKFTDCAFACGADYIVTNDSHFSDAADSPFPVFEVLSLEGFAEMMR
ncbi:MAG: putative toxin-antitoxin system toxin component, PIN family [Bacteroidales bacterium]|nr:putative toxin-antitoxin system toxin component, PIN family [Bacteroidales bacterium]